VALEMLKKTPVDLIISDHMMPQMSGIDFLTVVRDRYPEIMRLMITGHADLDTAIKAINHGEIHRFLTKPWDDDLLREQVRDAFQRYRPPKAGSGDAPPP
ncbi:MAG TPA: response regulator, partial [Dokdonella sp.]|nr:response regulator [Dokdonella sp.]